MLGSGPAVSRPTFRLERTVCSRLRADAAIGCARTRRRGNGVRFAAAILDLAPPPPAESLDHEPFHPPTPSPAPEARRSPSPSRPWPRSRRRLRSPPKPARRAAPRPSPPVVELYTSEGCNSCPPADRWLSKLKADPGVVALAFHVDYWDRLGWKDRFASAAFTARQAEQQASNGARFSYTPQVVVDGQDRKDWPGIAMPLGQPPGRAGRRAAGARRRPGHRDRRGRRPLTEAARRLLGGHRAGPRHRRQGRREPGRDAAARLRGARLPDRAGLVGHAPVQRRPSPSSCRREPMRRRVRARSTSSSSMPTAAGRCRR